MPGAQHNHNLVPKRPDIDAAVNALPDTAADTPLLDTQAADAAFFDLDERQSTIPKHVETIVDWVMDKLQEEGESVSNPSGAIVLTREQLLGGLSLTGRLSVAQTIFDTSPAVQEQWGVGSIEEHLRHAAETDTPETPPAA